MYGGIHISHNVLCKPLTKTGKGLQLLALICSKSSHISLPCYLGFHLWMQGTVMSLFESNYGPHLKSFPLGTSLLSPIQGAKTHTQTDSLSVKRNRDKPELSEKVKLCWSLTGDSVMSYLLWHVEVSPQAC